MRDEFIKLTSIKDPNAKIWNTRTSVLGPRHKAPELTSIRHPDKGVLVSRPEEIKKASLNHKIRTWKLKNGTTRYDNEYRQQRLKQTRIKYK